MRSWYFSLQRRQKTEKCGPKSCESMICCILEGTFARDTHLENTDNAKTEDLGCLLKTYPRNRPGDRSPQTARCTQHYRGQHMCTPRKTIVVRRVVYSQFAQQRSNLCLPLLTAATSLYCPPSFWNPTSTQYHQHAAKTYQNASSPSCICKAPQRQRVAVLLQPSARKLRESRAPFFTHH